MILIICNTSPGTTICLHNQGGDDDDDDDVFPRFLWVKGS